MSYHHAHQQYQESQVLTAGKGKLLLMAYDGAIRFVRQAQIQMAEKAYEEQNTAIIKAQRLLLELISTLNTQVDPDFSHRLTLLYEYLFNRLIEANVSDDMEALKEVELLLTDLRAAWADADRQVSMGGQEAPQERYAVLR